MAQNRQKDIPRTVDLLGIGRGGFGQGLINGLIEPDHVLEMHCLRRFEAGDPQADHAGAQVPELGGHLHQIKAHGMAQFAMAGGGNVQARGFFRPFALGLGLLFAGGLRGVHVPRSGQQNGLGMIAQGHAVH